MTEKTPKYFIDFLNRKGKNSDKVKNLFPNIRPYVFNMLVSEIDPQSSQDLYEFHKFAACLKLNFPELTGRDEEIIYLYLKNFKKYNKKLFVKIIQQIDKYTDAIYEDFSGFFDDETYNDDATKPVFLFALVKWYKKMVKHSGLFDMDVFDLLTTKGVKFSITDTSPRDSILRVFDDIYDV